MSALPITEYHYITRLSGVCNGRPIIRGTRTAVQTIVGYHKLGLGMDEILEGLPHLTPAQIYEALSYYHDHSEEIERDIEDSHVERLVERVFLCITS